MITNGAHADIVDQPGPAVGELIEQRRRRRRPIQQSTLILHIAAVTSAVLSASVDD